MTLIISFLLGSMFSIGLAISGMMNPEKVIGFLDFFGAWDPALIFVMGGGVTLNFVLFKFILRFKCFSANEIKVSDHSFKLSFSLNNRCFLSLIFFSISSLTSLF